MAEIITNSIPVRRSWFTRFKNICSTGISRSSRIFHGFIRSAVHHAKAPRAASIVFLYPEELSTTQETDAISFIFIDLS